MASYIVIGLQPDSPQDDGVSDLLGQCGDGRLPVALPSTAEGHELLQRHDARQVVLKRKQAAVSSSLNY